MEELIIWNLDDGECLRTIQAHSSDICQLAKLSNNKIVSFSLDKKIKLWNIENGDCLKTLEGHTEEVSSKELLN